MYIYGLLSDLPEASAGLGVVDGEGGGHDLCQLERADHVQHQTAQVRHLLVNTGISFTSSLVTMQLPRDLSSLFVYCSEVINQNAAHQLSNVACQDI